MKFELVFEIGCMRVFPSKFFLKIRNWDLWIGDPCERNIISTRIARFVKNAAKLACQPLTISVWFRVRKKSFKNR